MHPIVLTMSTGRCGTTFLEKTFKLNYGEDNHWVSHEYLRQQVTEVGVYHRCYQPECQRQMANDTIRGLLDRWREISTRGPVVDFGWTMRSLVPYFHDVLGDQFKAIYIHRHPVEVAASFKLIGSYSIYNSPQWAITPFHPRALYPGFQDRWATMTPFEKCLYLWLEVNAFALEVRQRYPDLQFLQLDSKDLFKSDQMLNSIAEFTGFPLPEDGLRRSTERNRRELFVHERRPIEDEWERYERHPEVIDLACRLGYNMDKEYVRQIIPKYQLPPGIMPLIRNKTGYWAHRENVGRLLRRMGLRK